MVGIDLGIKDFAVLSDGTRLPAPRFARKRQKRLQRAHRGVSRKRLRSRNRERARAKLARVYARAADQRRDFLHKLTTNLVRDYDVIAIEDLGVTGLARTKLAGAIHDAAFHEFRRQLEYKARWRGKRLIIIDRFFPSSKMCSSCQAVNSELTPRIREWTCSCGTVHDRDLNAAQNLRAEAIKQLVAVGRTDTKNARGVRVSPPTEAADDEAGISRRASS